MRRRRVLLCVVVLALGYALLCGAGGVFVAEAALHPGRRVLLESDRQHAELMAQRRDSHLANVTVTTVDGTTLSGWIVRPRQGGPNFVMLLHGLSDNRMGMIGYAESFVSHGYNVLMADARAHGTSGGELASYGLVEANDIRRWVDCCGITSTPIVFTVLGNRWERHSCCRACQWKTGFAA